MASENTLRLRQIQPRVGAPYPPPPNQWRRTSRAAAKAAGVSRRRWVRALKKAER